MKPWFTFWSSADHPKKSTIRMRVFFLADTSLPPNSLLRYFLEEYSEGPLPIHIAFASTHQAAQTLQELLQHPDFELRLGREFPSNSERSIARIEFEANGSISKYSVKGEPITFSLKDVLQDGLLEVFHKNGGLLKAPKTAHYVKPSGKHSNAFIRTGDTLVSDAEVTFVAATLFYRILTKQISHIYCDTSSISAVAYALNGMRTAVSPTPPRIHTFLSYKGIEQIDLTHPDATLFLLSASTSAELERRIVEKTGIASSQIVTIFYRGATTPTGLVLCDLGIKGSKYPAIDEIDNQRPDDCKLCRQGRVCIWVLGDQFETRMAEAKPKLVKIDDCPEYISRFIQQVQGMRMILCHHQKNRHGDIKELFIDLEPFLKSPNDPKFVRLKSRLDGFLSRGIALTLKRVIYCDDDSSYTLAEMVLHFFSDQIPNATRPELISARSLLSGTEIVPLAIGSTLVVAGVASTGRSLLAVSQRLRDLQTNDAVSYLIGLMSNRTREEREELESNLSYGATGPRERPVMVLERVVLPDAGRSGGNPWTHEEHFLESIREAAERSGNRISAAIESRLDTLSRAPMRQGSGLMKNLFLNTLLGSDLQLRRFFAFFKFTHQLESVTQAEVYFVVRGILHYLRTMPRDVGGLENGIYHRTVLAPRNFDRFNDGVIQAAFLRAASSEELDYSILDSASAEMREIISTVIENSGNSTGEASLEFVLALAIGKLRLNRADSAIVADLLERNSTTFANWVNVLEVAVRALR
jgi:hypothetical protein